MKIFFCFFILFFGFAICASAQISLPIGTLPAGKTITVTYEVQIDDPFPSGVDSVSAQGTVSGSNFATQLTDDPETPPVTIDPTITEVLANPEISVSGNSQNITDGQTAISQADNTDFDSTGLQEPVIKNFEIQNTGDVPLDISAISLSGNGAGEFSVVSATLLSIPNGGNSILQIQFSPQSVGTFSATISIANNDVDENPFTFAIEGRGFVNNGGCAYGMGGGGGRIALRPSPACP